MYRLWVLSVSVLLRYIIYYIKRKWQKKAVLMDFLETQNGQQIYGTTNGLVITKTNKQYCFRGSTRWNWSRDDREGFQG